MQSKVYDLPEILFANGEIHDLRFCLFADTRKLFSASGATAAFSVMYSANRASIPVLSRPMSIVANDDGVENILTITFLPQKIVNLRGEYIYQITIQDMSGGAEIPSQGTLGITDNIDKAIIK